MPGEASGMSVVVEDDGAADGGVGALGALGALGGLVVDGEVWGNLLNQSVISAPLILLEREPPSVKVDDTL
jgi:hypothetical protein